MNGKALLGGVFVFGLVCGYAWSLNRLLALRDRVDELSQPPLKMKPEDKWENQEPNTKNEYELVRAKRDWIRKLMAKYIAPYLDKNISAVLIQEWIMPVENHLIELESQQQAKNRAGSLVFMQKSSSGQMDD